MWLAEAPLCLERLRWPGVPSWGKRRRPRSNLRLRWGDGGLPYSCFEFLNEAVEGAFHNTPRGQVDSKTRINIEFLCPPVHAMY